MFPSRKEMSELIVGPALTFAEKDPGRKWLRPHRAGSGQCDRDRSPCRILRHVL